MSKLIRFPELKKLVPLSRPTIWRLERRGLFPARKKIGANSVAWLEEEILEWIKKREPVNSTKSAAESEA